MISIRHGSENPNDRSILTLARNASFPPLKYSNISKNHTTTKPSPQHYYREAQVIPSFIQSSMAHRFVSPLRRPSSAALAGTRDKDTSAASRDRVEEDLWGEFRKKFI